MKGFITVIGGVNVDISAALIAPFVQHDSIPGQVAMDCGGVARNIAHNLCLLGHSVSFVTIFGGDVFGDICRKKCEDIGLNISQSASLDHLRNGIYLCVNDQSGDMVVGVADTSIIDNLTPEFLSARMSAIHQSTAVVADANLSVETLSFLFDYSRSPVFVDAVSTTKAQRVMTALRESQSHQLFLMKLNRQEALAVTGCADEVKAAQLLLNEGVEHVLITLGAEGVYYCGHEIERHLPPIPVEVMNTTGAGDALLAGVVHGFARQMPMIDSVVVGLKAARATLMTAKSVNSELSKYLS